MKKIYEKPNLAIENFVTDEVMGTRENALRSDTYSIAGHDWDFLSAGDANGTNGHTQRNNVLNGVDYTSFAQ